MNKNIIDNGETTDGPSDRPNRIRQQNRTESQLDALPDETATDYGDMNLKDAQESGYTDKKGHAVSMAKRDVKGSPTGAYTDIGAGRSSVVHKHGETSGETSGEQKTPDATDNRH
jgi:hypothetical protein